MTKEMLKKICEEKEIKKEKWQILDNIDYIKLKNGSFLFPNIEHCRFLFTDTGNLLIQYSESYKIGAKFLGIRSISGNGKGIMLSESDFQKGFRKPTNGDILVVWKDFEIIYQGYILNAINSFNGFSIELNASINLKPGCSVGFYDPKKLELVDTLDKSFFSFLKFIKPITGKKSKYGIYSQKIKLNKIQDIIGKAEV